LPMKNCGIQWGGIFKTGILYEYDFCDTLPLPNYSLVELNSVEF